MRASVLALLASTLLAGPALAETRLTIMSFNVYGGGANDNKPVDETVAVTRRANADTTATRGTRLEGDPCDADNCKPRGDSVAKAIAEQLGFHFYDQTAENPALWANAILSRYPIGPATKNDLGVEIDVDGRKVFAFNIHLTDFPYQPYQLLNIEYGPAPYLKTAEEAVAAATAARGPALDLLKADLEAAGDAPAFIFGDFNEPSALDWTQAAVDAKLQPLAVEWPTTATIQSWGFTDTYRAANPDVVAKPAFTWTPWGDPKDPEDHQDRIDFAFARAPGLKVESAAVYGEQVPQADVVVDPWPADHRATVATIVFE